MVKKSKSIQMEEIKQIEDTQEEAPRVFVTSMGVEVPLRPISPLLMQRVHASVPLPQPPTYEVEIVGGAKQTFYHDEESVAEDPEAKRLWNQYQDDLAEARALRNTRALRVMLYKGTAMQMPEGDDWIEEHRFLGLDVPDDARELYQYYMETEVLGTAEDVQGLMAAISELMGVKAEDVNAAIDSFRDPVGQRGDGETAEGIAQTRESPLASL